VSAILEAARAELNSRCNAIEECYEFMLAYAAQGLDFDFDPEFHRDDLARRARLRAKNAHLLMALADMDWGICPTEFQRSTVPPEFHARTCVIFDGIDTAVVRPDPGASVTVGGRTLRAGDEVLTFVNRNLEPYRGYHVFMRALPEILRQRPDATVLVVGGDGVSYGASAPEGKNWKQIFFDEVKDRIDPARVHFGIPQGVALQRLEIDWPDGAASAVDAPQAQTLVTVTRGG